MTQPISRRSSKSRGNRREGFARVAEGANSNKKEKEKTACRDGSGAGCVRSGKCLLEGESKTKN